ncbi:class I SAM-dependent methyltransferase [Crocosphaera sp. XPORK-15E]|uniref:class I SAM-dependent methyltransferase n=1 Tax=Crocosphaera sp. XPORK-15E TaxID=3110247 RepID=UPI002B1F05A7|nr:class I SAM-dependent methyltransferase [Crocosphaera sp. XPORK-15E]MEA5536743.1 class I SAM-dependent methyltransferase [Crocosphaera sp. XPORK-15E]
MSITEAKKTAIRRTIKDLQHFFSIKGVQVLEIGSLGTVVAEDLLKLGAKSVICSNIKENADIIESERIKYMQLDATKTGLESESVDFVFGRAVLEHIDHIDCLRDEIFRILKPGGRFYLDGAPMWASPTGHHLWVKTPSGKFYNFFENCPLHNWEHLSLSEAEMVKVLLSRGIESEDADALTNFVYHSSFLNRTLTSTICTLFKEHKMLDIAITKDCFAKTPPTNLITRFNLIDLTTSRLCIAGRKKFYEMEPNTLSFKHLTTESWLRTKLVLKSIKYKIQSILKSRT